MTEPLLHSQITDALPEDHPLAWTSIYCVKCGAMVHGIPNENMRPWMETGKGAWCLEDFTAAFAEDDDQEAWALDNDSSVPCCEVVVVQGKHLAAKCGHPLPCPQHLDGSSDG